MSTATEYMCPSCQALNETWCYHTPRMWELATAFARLLFPEDLSVASIEAFLEDAESVSPFVGPEPWSIAEIPMDQTAKVDTPMSRVYILTSPTGRHILAVDAEQERMANQCVVPAQYICTLPPEEVS